MLVRVCLTATLIATTGCEIRRDRPVGEGYHEAGWANTDDGGKHATWLRNEGYPIEPCQVCHGQDGAESPVLVSCNKSGCHNEGVNSCGTCHGSAVGPRPLGDAHDKHSAFCSECHQVPKALRDMGHLNSTLDVVFSGLATKNQASPTWDIATQSCSSAYCHNGKTISWNDPLSPETPCDRCHGAPPDSHARFAYIATPASCTTCHPDAKMPTHINGSVETNAMACDTCHGHGPLGAPPADLNGSTSALQRGVGAHRRHLDGTLADRLGKVVACSVCHVVPISYDAPGHIDTSAPTDVPLALGAYDSTTGQCVTSCHFDVSPGPSWTDTSGAARACDACHGYPPAFTRKGTPHTPSAQCSSCHTYAPATHVNGAVDMTP